MIVWKDFFPGARTLGDDGSREKAFPRFCREMPVPGMTIPEPNPLTERTRVRIDYVPERDHDYSVEKPSMVEIEPEHFVYASPSEIEAFRKIIDAAG